MNQYKGLFIVIEGLDGVGKSSTERILQHNLNKKGVHMVLTHEPFIHYPNGKLYLPGMKMYHTIQSPKFARTGYDSRDLFAKNAKQHMEKIIKPNLEKGNLVVCDRGLLSSLAYQGHYHKINGKVVETHHVLKANEQIQGNSMVKPDLNIYLHLDRKDELARLNGRSNKSDAYDKALQNPAKMARMHRHYQYGLDIMKNKLGVNYRKVDASQSPQMRAKEIQYIIHQVGSTKSRKVMHNVSRDYESQPKILTHQPKHRNSSVEYNIKPRHTHHVQHHIQQQISIHR